MGDMRDYFQAIKFDRRVTGERRRDAATEEFPFAKQLAIRHGLRLVRHSEVHYQLMPMNRAWILDIYPGNRRLKGGNKRLGLGSNWTLADVVKACAADEVELKVSE